jgi:hypothetical protein
VLGAGAAALQALALSPAGIVRSTYTERLTLLVVLAAILAGVFARLAEKRSAGSAPWAYGAVLAAATVQWAAATSPVMVVSDAVFHSHKLAAVAGGDLFPTSLTPSGLRFPYGVSFYLLLSPLERLGFGGPAVLRHAAGLAGVLASAALFRLALTAGPRVAALSVGLLQLLPVTFDLYSYGNLSNVFGQAATVGFVAWWAREGKGRVVVGAALLAVASLAHLSSFVVLAAFCAVFLAAPGARGLTSRGDRMVIVLALGLAGAYYGHFAGLAWGEASRLGSGERAAPLAAMLGQCRAAFRQWGGGALILAAFGAPLARTRLDASLRAFWGAGALLMLVAVASPLEVRYLYALTLPLAVAAAAGSNRLWRDGPVGRVAAVALVGWQATVASLGILEGVLHRYRP